MKNLSKEIMWVFSLENPMSLPSYIVSGIMPADYHKIQKIIFLKHHDPKKFLLEKKPKVLIISKVFHSGIVDLVLEAKKLNIKIISIFDDWHFDKTLENSSQYNFTIAKNSNAIVAKTKKAVQIIYNNTKIKGLIIPDCLRYKMLESKDLFCNPHKVCWFGTHNNHPSLFKGINEMSKISSPILLKIITNRIENLKNSLLKINNKITLEFIEWSLTMHEDIIDSEIIIIPLIDNKNSLVKSSNRIVDSLNMGKFVIINENKQFEEFRKFCYFGDLKEGLDWVYRNKKDAKLKVIEGQKYVNKNYSLEAISKKWKSLITKL